MVAVGRNPDTGGDAYDTLKVGDVRGAEFPILRQTVTIIHSATPELLTPEFCFLFSVFCLLNSSPSANRQLRTDNSRNSCNFFFCNLSSPSSVLFVK
jgi:hypothetical protein